MIPYFTFNYLGQTQLHITTSKNKGLKFLWIAENNFGGHVLTWFYNETAKLRTSHVTVPTRLPPSTHH